MFLKIFKIPPHSYNFRMIKPYIYQYNLTLKMNHKIMYQINMPNRIKINYLIKKIHNNLKMNFKIQ